MKVLQFAFRAGVSLFLALIASFSAAVIYFDYSGYKTLSDRAFLVAVPALAIAFILFQAFPAVWNWLKQRQVGVLAAFALAAVLGAIVAVLPGAVSRVYYLGMFVVAVALWGFMLPAAPAVERMRAGHSMTHYLTGFILSLIFAYLSVGFLDGVLVKPFNVLLFTVLLILAGSVCGFYLVRRAAHSFRDGFLGSGLNVLLVFALPVFFVAIVFASAQFPSVFFMEYILISAPLTGIFFAGALVAGAWGLAALEQFEARGMYESFKQTRAFTFIKENLPGLYAAGMFFLVNLILARALNHPTFSINSIVFEADAGPWMSILGLPEGHDVNRAVHPLVLITLRPLVAFVGLFMADKWYLAPMIVIAAMSALCVLMAWMFIKRATQKETYAFLFALLLGATAAHLLFGSLTETYVFGMTSLIFFLLLVQADEKRFSVLVPAGLLVFGVTLTNIAQGMIALFFKKFGFWKLVYYGVVVLAAGIALTAFVSVLYPGNQTFFFVPADLAFEARFSKPIYKDSPERIVEKTGIVGRTMFLYGVVAPTPIEDYTRKTTDPIIDLKTYDAHDHIYAWYDGLAYAPLALWLLLLAGAFFQFFKNLRSSPHLPLMLGLLGILAFNYLLHMNYGTELFLYTPYWTYALVFFAALAFANLAGKRWFESVLTIFLLMLMVNNLWFLFVVMRGLAPFYGAS